MRYASKNQAKKHTYHYVCACIRSVFLAFAISASGALLRAETSPAVAAEDTSVEAGYSALQAGDADTALNMFERALQSNDENISALLGKAMIYAERAEHKKAFSTYDFIVQNYPKNAFAWNGRGLAAFNMEDFDEALSSFEKATVDQPINGFFYESLAWTRMCRGEFSEAADSAKTATIMYNRKGESSLYPLLIAYFSYLEAGKIKEAQVTLNYASKNKPVSAWPSPIVDYLEGSIDEYELISFVMNTAEETEAHTYIGLKLRLIGLDAESQQHLDWVSQHGDDRVFEYTLARSINMRNSIASVIN